MTQKEKIARASQFCYMVKSISNSIASACRDYDESWAFQYTKQLTENADNLLKMLNKKLDPSPSPLSPHFILNLSVRQVLIGHYKDVVQ